MGGAMYYLKDGLGSKKGCKQIGAFLAILFAVFCVLASFGIGNMSQINTISSNLDSAFGINPVVVDPWANERDAMQEYGVTLTKLEDVKEADCLIVAVAHNEFKELSVTDLKQLFRKCPDDEKVLIDVKGLYKIEDLKKSGIQWWRL